MIWRQHNSSASPKAPPPQLSMSRRIVGHYDRLVECGTLRENVHQKYVIQQLAQLQHTLKNYSNSMYLSLLTSTINSNDDKSHLTLHKDCHFMPSENRSGGTINKVQYLLSSYAVLYVNKVNRCRSLGWVGRACWKNNHAIIPTSDRRLSSADLLCVMW